jgi:hypothetical protein
VTVGTTKKSAATTCPIWFARNVRHVCDGDGRRRPMYFATVDWLTVMPSFRSSPWIRGAPQRGLASDMSKRENLDVQHAAGANQRTNRHEHGYDDGHHRTEGYATATRTSKNLDVRAFW